VFLGKAKIFDGEQKLLESLETTPDVFENFDMVIVRYEGPVGGPGMPEMLDSTSRLTALCREKNIVVGLMTDGRFSGGSVGLVIGHVGPEAANGGPIGLVGEGDDITVDLNKNELNCEQLKDPLIFKERKMKWEAAVTKNNGTHPSVGEVDTRLLNRMRCTAVSAVYGAGMHPDRKLWVNNPREVKLSKFEPLNKFKEGSI
jgi:dihydroxy-acid dehydratase